MAFTLKFKDKDEGIDKEIRFFDRQSANSNAEKLKQYGHTEVIVEDSFKGNYVGTTIKFIGYIVIIAGIIIGTVQGNYIGNLVSGEFNVTVALYWLAVSVVTGVLLIGIAEIINLLDAMNKKIKT
ncbi:hypothetical protein EHS13_08805 [Paenibacillus psychroresistens]|uniref:Uncharacterized protein n=2 Tax=Paenibacillus psychroresistens TaxID=1778678 RepID=A0A6B8RGX1_9BACL|nr:hypothetical protein EHS13_08805 [Paenibacillus psychroresistens]